MPASKRITAEAAGMKATTNQAAGIESSGVPNKKLTGKEKKLKRKEEVAKAKAREETVRQAYSRGSILAEFQPFRKFERNGLSITLEERRAEELTAVETQFVERLLESNMKKIYGDNWPSQAATRRQQMAEPDALYLFLHDSATSCDASSEDPSTTGSEDLVGFVHLRFVIEEDVPVLYVYELQLGDKVQRHGLGKFLMQLMELIARKSSMKGVMLTVQKRNKGALDFYLNRMKYIVDPISPSKSHPLAQPEDYDYEILSKIHDPETKQHLEERCKLAQAAWLSEGY
ncbi:acetyltransferase [Klebsormidium nitens]|uniref:N-alpha-acetyltransferase 40 n=1 Tax=Klebsormidium nitens TaxID=105231 RepID=A0A1Y1HXE8_KLENI|nr:acetyltransferase [Klebsormidium nitens]|eukprot:GAQ83315.1 acetyltransferase [Klebsormidium nitens]